MVDDLTLFCMSSIRMFSNVNKDLGPKAKAKDLVPEATDLTSNNKLRKIRCKLETLLR